MPNVRELGFGAQFRDHGSPSTGKPNMQVAKCPRDSTSVAGVKF